MVQGIDVAVEALLQLTIELEQAVTKNDSDPDMWLSLLDKREAMIHEVDGMISVGCVLTDSHRRILSQIHEINQGLLPLMLNRKQEVQKKLADIQRSKISMNTYHDTGPNAYGAFFDSKK
ncbi:flagellar protein FliT [Brevibacillus ruminantium]|uniref:Flagellar protein FliT n=1 Tax=Brevibacillus ruminantium TaxID=2950604 RepID=A0ABY4WE25_9BACL|nr:flagellar protein FliT [Brevibacillus ruminantium]USG65317.1 flagellar protein FliT [Brevibacillus ruminantium]